jgi:hypothetical protein
MQQQLYNLIALTPLISLACLAIHACIMWEGMILHFIRRWYRWAATTIIDVLCTDYVTDELHRELMPVINNVKLAKLTNVAAIIIKPVYACLICMSSVWSIITWLLLGNAISWHLIPLMLFVCGFNIIIDSVIYKLRGHGDEGQL